MSTRSKSRVWSVGPELKQHGVCFRVWAPARKRVEVVVEGGPGATRKVPLERNDDDVFCGTVQGAGAGTLYRFCLDDDDKLYPDPASRFQPAGPHGPSQVVDGQAFTWNDQSWRGPPTLGQVIYELHIGTFTKEGTWAAATEQLSALAELGVTMLELMPVNEFAGAFGWGYDGVDLYAPYHHYGAPDDMRRFVDRAHALGLAVILDVVYNHLGPDGNYLKAFSPAYFTTRYKNDWGEALNFDGVDCQHVRSFFVENAAYWIDEFHLDGLRIDATQDIHDASKGEHILAALTRHAREAAGERSIYVVAENEPQHTKLVRTRERGGHGLDALWNDDFHHLAMVAATSRNEAYYTDYLGAPQEFLSALRWGYLYQGQHYAWQKKARGTPAFDLRAEQFVAFLQNHDQIANSGRGLRGQALTSPALWRALTAVLLLGPQTPMLFMGQEFAASAPFLYFADHTPELAQAVHRGRREFLGQFPSLAGEEAQARVDPPAQRETFVRCKLDHGERERHAEVYALHKDLLTLRREDPAFSTQRADRMYGAVLGSNAFALRFFHEHGDRLLLVNLGRDTSLSPLPEPLLAPPAESRWERRWSSEFVRYGGAGTSAVERDDGSWHLPGASALVLAALPADDA